MTDATSKSRFPQPKPLPIIGNLADIDGAAPVQGIAKLAERVGPNFRLTVFGKSMTIIGEQALVDELCDETRFQKALHRPLQTLRTLGGDGLFTAETEESNWGKAHRLLMPAFGPLGLRTMFPKMLDVAEQLMVRWDRFGEAAVIDVPDNMTRLTLDTIALSAFDYRFNSFYQNEMHPFVSAMVGALAESGSRARMPDQITRMMLLRNRRFEADIDLLHRVADQLVGERLADPRLGERGDLLDAMLTAVDKETGEKLSRENVRYQMVTFLIAGHETTSGLLSFAIYEMLRNPAALKAARAEVDEMLGADTPTVDDIGRLTYIEQLLMETLRLWPTAPAFAVRPFEATVIGDGYEVAPDDILLILTPLLHRDPKVWDAPETFRPERFSPESAALLAPNAWKPFGNGQRACIGRGFAMQEAVLVLAMILQRFDIQLADADYKLVVHETLTLKPEGLKIRARRRDQPAARRSRVMAPSARPMTQARTPAAAPSNGDLIVLFGSNTGTSESFATRIAADAGGQGFRAEAQALDERVDDIDGTAPIIVVTASYEGRPPDNAVRFVNWLESLPEGALAGRQYAIFGCGNRQWARTWQAVPKRVEAAFQRAGAAAVLERGEADAAGDLFGAFEDWCARLWPALAAAQGRDAVTPSAETALDVEILYGHREKALRLDDLKRGVVLENRELVDMTMPGARSKRHIAVRLPEGMTYRAGDYLAVLAANPRETVERVMTRFALAPDAEVMVHGSPMLSSLLPLDRPIPAFTLLSDYVELQQPATRSQIHMLAEKTPCPPEAQALLRLAEPSVHEAEVLEKRVSLIDLMERFGSASPGFGQFLAAMPPMRARQYSISSSPLADPSICSLTVSVVDAPAFGGEHQFRGVASTYLARQAAGASLAVSVRPSQAGFHLPADTALPIIMVAAGSGVAPFRGFIQERAAMREDGVVVGPGLLFFGARHPEMDYLYRAEFEDWKAAGVVSVRAAFEEKPETGVVFVQDALWRDRLEVADLLAQGAVVYVCGDGRLMAPAVRDAFVRIYEDAMDVTRKEAEAWARKLEAEAVRYVADVFS